jgi:type II secretory pathway predicted ATPase ExeA/ActR/RegA family two-component response regulator
MSNDVILASDTSRASPVGLEARPALVVDDDPETREVLKDFLRRRGLAVLEAQNGLEALLSVKRHRPGVVVLDLNMPRLGGLEALKRIRPFDPTIRVAVVTDDRDATIHWEARALGATVVLTKPVDLAQLETALGLTPPIDPVPESTSLLPEAPPRPTAAAICVVDDDALRRDEALGVTATVGLDAALELRAEDASEAAEGGDPVAGLAEDLVLDEARALPTEGGDDRGEGETTRGLGWLVGAVRAFLGAAPAREAGESESEGEPSATSVFERLQEEVDETTPGEVDQTAPGQGTMSYYGSLGLTKEPFSTSPDPAFFYESASHKAVLYRLQIAIKLKRGLSLVLGDVGMGKTTLSRRLFQILSREEKVSSHLILNPVYETEAEFLTALVKLFGIAPPSGTLPVARSLEILEGYLFEKGVEQERTVVLLIDEAQRLSSSALELLRALLNYETNEYKLLQLILMGQMELLPRIKDMKNLWDRISLKRVIGPFDQADTEAMIAFRLRKAGYAARRSLFTPEGIQEIYRHSQGSPRRITTLCHDALEQLVMSDKDEVDAAMVRGLIKQVLV